MFGYICKKGSKRMRRQHIIDMVADVMHREYPSAKVILYGSEARNEATENSDVDLLIIVNEDGLAMRKMEYDIHKSLLSVECDTGVCLSPYVVSSTAWKNHITTPFTMNIMREGIEI